MSSRLDLERVIQAIGEVLPSKGVSPLHEPTFQGNEWNYVRECIDSGWVSSAGCFVERFEKDLAEFVGVRYAIATASGTAALHICLKLAGVERGDEVLVPTLTFVATANAVTYCGASPHFVDCAANSLGVDPGKLGAYLASIAAVDQQGCWNRATGARIRALLPMHTFGHPVDVEPLLRIAGEYKLEVVEDAAESLGSYYRGVHTGSFGRLAAMSFNGNKIVTTGGGGAILTNDASLAKAAKHLTTTARVPHRWAFLHDQTAYNYRLPNLNAALGCAQLERLPRMLEQKRKLADLYHVALAGIAGLQVFREASFARSNYWLNAIMLDPGFETSRDDLLDRTNAVGWLTRPAWTLMHRLPMYKDCPRMRLDGAEDLERRLVNLPSSPSLVNECN